MRLSRTARNPQAHPASPERQLHVDVLASVDDAPQRSARPSSTSPWLPSTGDGECTAREMIVWSVYEEDVAMVAPENQDEAFSGATVSLGSGSGVLVGDSNRQVNLYLNAPTPPTGLPSVARATSSPPATPPRDELRRPVLIGRPPLQVDAFQPRSHLRTGVRQAGAGDATAGVTQVMAGDGGTGKTQLAAAEFRQALRDGARMAVWVNASTREGVLAAYAEACSAIRPRRRRDEDATEQAEAFLRWLAIADTPWIVVLDDVSDPVDLQMLWPSGPTGRVLVTTRRRDAAIAARGQVIDVGVFNPVESLTYPWVPQRLAHEVLRAQGLNWENALRPSGTSCH
jgi:hypothetical protein